MEVTYKNDKIGKICTDAKTAERAYGREMADKIHQRIDELHAADTVEMMIQWHIGRCHPLRLVFEKKGEEIQIASILEIVDYH